MGFYERIDARGVRETGRPVSFVPKGALTHHLLKQAVVALPLVGHVRSPRGIAAPAGAAGRCHSLVGAAVIVHATGSVMGWQNTISHSHRLPASTCQRQLDTDTGWNKSFHPCWWYVAFHDAPVAIKYGRRAAVFHSSPSERMVDNGDLSFGGQNSQPRRRTLRRGCCGLSELFPDAQRV